MDDDLVELVLLWGPPCSGKTRYFYSHLSSSHLRLSPSDDPSLSLHRFISIVISHLVGGRNVAIDDVNGLPQTRRSFIVPVRAKVCGLLLFFVVSCCFLLNESVTMQWY